MSTSNVRLGIVYRGSIVKEEIIDREIDISVGLRADSTVQFSPKDYPDFPDHLDVLFNEGGKFYLVVPSDPAARINLRGASQADNVQTVRNKRCIPIGDVAGGSVVVGDVTVMFQFVRGYGAPTMTHERTVLRIGLVFEDRLISDRIFPNDKVVSIGASKDDTVVLDQLDYTGPSLSFENNKDGSVQLKAPGDMKLRVAVQDDAPRDVKELIQRGKARMEGDTSVAHLTLGARGRAVLGPYSILFQVVRQKVVVPTFEKQSPVQRVLGIFLKDVVWTACFSIALLLGGGVVTQAVLYQRTHGQYLKKAQKAEEHVAETYEVLIEEKEKPPEPEEEPEEEPKETAPEMKPEAKPEKKPKKVEKKAPEKKAEKPQSTGKTVDPEERKRNARKAVTKKTIAGALLGKGGAATKLFAEGGEGDGEVMAKTFGGGSDEGSKDNGPGGGVKLAGGGGGGGTVEKVKTGKSKGFGKRKKSATKVVAKKREKKIKVSLSAGALGGSGSGKSGVARVIARKNSAVRRCYEGALRKTPGLSGKVKVRFMVGTAGTITSVNVLGASGEFAACIKRKFGRIRGLPLLPSPQSFTQSYVFTKN